jgi:uncharacterized protein (TIGR02271 family)
MSSSLDHSDAVDPAVTRVDRETVVPLFEEELSVAKKVVETARVRVSRVTHTHQQLVDELLHQQKVEVEHVPIDRQIEVMPSIRQEGDVTIIPVVEEVLRVERRLVLKEEVHIRKIQTTERYQESVTLRRQQAQVTRLPLTESAALETGAESNASEPRKEH